MVPQVKNLKRLANIFNSHDWWFEEELNIQLPEKNLLEEFEAIQCKRLGKRFKKRKDLLEEYPKGLPIKPFNPENVS